MNMNKNIIKLYKYEYEFEILDLWIQWTALLFGLLRSRVGTPEHGRVELTTFAR